MELNTTVPTEPPRDSASMVLLRDAEHGLEVFLLQRHSASEAFGGAYVFPGGKLDAQDQSPHLAGHLDQSPVQLHGTLKELDLPVWGAAGLYVAAIREAYEECGVLFAQPVAASTEAAAVSPASAFHQLLQTQNLQLQTRALLPWSRWITPRMPAVSSKRFDTRFFLAAMPNAQTAVHDNVEATHSMWAPPRRALEQYRDGQIELAPPQIMGLAHLARHTSVSSVMTEAHALGPSLVLPVSSQVNGQRMLSYPGDPLHPVRQRALPGPTRLWYRAGKFEPPGGFEALFL